MAIRELKLESTPHTAWQDSPGMTGLEAAVSAGGTPELFFWDKQGEAHVLLSLRDSVSRKLFIFNEVSKPTVVS